MGANQPIVGSLAQAFENGYQPVDAMRVSKSVQRETKRKRKGKGDASVVDGDDAYMGPWAAYQVEQAQQIEVDDAEDGAEEWRAEKKRREDAQDAAKEAMKHAREEKTIFHGKSASGVVLMVRQGVTGLCRQDVYAHSDGSRCQAQSVRGKRTAKCLSAR